MAMALFINGVFEAVLKEILEAQKARAGGVSFLQPHRGSVIKQFQENPPDDGSPIHLYLSTTDDLGKVAYIAQILKWEDKRVITEARRSIVLEHLKAYQPNEVQLFLGTELGEGKAVNLLTIRDLRKLEIQPPIGFLQKTKDGSPLKPRKRSGNWSYVRESFEIDLLSGGLIQSMDSVNSELSQTLEKAKASTVAELQQRLAAAPKKPQQDVVVKVGYRRNPDVIVAVLNRADGNCERCKKPAPFLRKSDGNPFLEVHHKKTLADGGDDTVENAEALCPNCHRHAHHG